jgi:hypothetical protein
MNCTTCERIENDRKIFARPRLGKSRGSAIVTSNADLVPRCAVAHTTLEFEAVLSSLPIASYEKAEYKKAGRDLFVDPRSVRAPRTKLWAADLPQRRPHEVTRSVP